MAKDKAIVIGAGIVGLATTRALAHKGFSVTVIERSEKAVGASIRNFGMIWPIGQPGGILYDRALRSRARWKEQCKEAGIWYRETGSLHLAYNNQEWTVLQEVYAAYCKDRKLKLLNKCSVTELSPAIVQDGLLGGLYSADEMLVDPRQAVPAIASLLSATRDVEFLWGKCVSYIADQTVYIGQKEQMEADLIFVCGGIDFETLYPEIFSNEPIAKCKLQMMRFASENRNGGIGPALCGGLSLVHYKSFKAAASLENLKKHYLHQIPQFLKWGIHVMIAENGQGELIIGDSHEHGKTFDPFNKSFLNEMILSYLETFANIKDYKQIDSWNGIYAKLTDGRTELFCSPEAGVYIVNGLGGAGMTLSFGLAEEIIAAVV